MGEPRFMRTKDNDYVDQEQIAVCPFNRSHVMKTTKLQYHIVKCMKNYTGKKVVCPYNHSEYFEPEELIFHLANCASRAAAEVANKRIVASKPVVPVNASTGPFPASDRHSDENWGLDDED
ncbi:U11-48K-like Hypothetical proteinHC zinc finger [Nesidiocoris tenuis]|uniref:CHHC U11-48K-type domain-containing protein n=1 Tax=Nesidiocoris tenuis TaxID=355587 RepID=A0ABN7AT86_9HEMI|nr:U11-48K-like Hypothetical proteinHC zinc finger [Nesidiocoris tenuis]